LVSPSCKKYILEVEEMPKKVDRKEGRKEGRKGNFYAVGSSVVD